MTELESFMYLMELAKPCTYMTKSEVFVCMKELATVTHTQEWIKDGTIREGLIDYVISN